MLFSPNVQSANLNMLSVVVSKHNSITGISKEELIKIFRGEQQNWSSGERIIILVPPKGTVVRNAMLNTIYNMSEVGFQQFWLAKTYQMEVSSPPKEVKKNTVLEVLLHNMPGGVAVVDARTELNSGVVLRIDGFLPNEKQYPLMY